MRHRTLLHAGLALLLAFTQVDVVVHVVSHLADASTHSPQPDKQLPHSQACEKCLAFASISGALPSMSLIVSDWASTVVAAAYRPFSFHTRPHQAYASRAPPQLA